jgi:predicted flap endonuclease-1-like 5' DNA nuclease
MAKMENSCKPQIPTFVTLVIGLMIGAVFGLVALGWWLWPVKWVNADPSSLNYTAKIQYLRASIEAFGYNQDINLAKERYQALGGDAGPALTLIAQQPGELPDDLITSFSQSVVGLTPAEVATKPPISSSVRKGLSWQLFAVIGVGILTVALVFAWIVLRIRKNALLSGELPAPIEEVTEQGAVAEEQSAEPLAIPFSMVLETEEQPPAFQEEIVAQEIIPDETAMTVKLPAEEIMAQEEMPPAVPDITPLLFNEEPAIELVAQPTEELSKVVESVEELSVPQVQVDENLITQPSTESTETRQEMDPWLTKLPERLVLMESIGEENAQRLGEVGILTVGQLIKGGAIPKARKAIADRTGIDENLILKWINQIDLIRVRGAGKAYAELLENAGVTSVADFAREDPQNLLQKLIVANEQLKMVSKLPVLSQVTQWVDSARQLEEIVKY